MFNDGDDVTRSSPVLWTLAVIAALMGLGLWPIAVVLFFLVGVWTWHSRVAGIEKNTEQ